MAQPPDVAKQPAFMVTPTTYVPDPFPYSHVGLPYMEPQVSGLLLQFLFRLSISFFSAEWYYSKHSISSFAC
jgi:hypothetical protein